MLCPFIICYLFLSVPLRFCNQCGVGPASISMQRLFSSGQVEKSRVCVGKKSDLLFKDFRFLFRKMRS